MGPFSCLPKLPQNASRRKPSEEALALAPGDYFELVARQIPASTKNVAAELTWFALEMVA